MFESDSRGFNAGTFVWSGFDYLGESRGWPQTVKTRGAVGDAAGFTKESAWWLRSYWLSAVSETDHGRPANPPALVPSHGAMAHPGTGVTSTQTTAFIVESWTPPSSAGRARGGPNRTVHVYSNAASVALTLNGEPVAGGGRSTPDSFGIARFSVPFAPGTLQVDSYLASDLGAHGAPGEAPAEVATSFAVATPGPPATLALSLDAPNAATGTGTALVADGEDTAMVRATILDADGQIASGATGIRVTFTVRSGNGRVWATHSGDASTHEPNLGHSKLAYHGLARAFVRSAEDRATPGWHRRRLREIDVDGGRLTLVAAPTHHSGGEEGAQEQDQEQEQGGSRGGQSSGADAIVVQATATGIDGSATISIPLTTDLGQLATAITA